MNFVWRLLFISLVIIAIIYYFSGWFQENKTDSKGVTSKIPEGKTLFLAGDVMTGRGIDQIMPHSVDPVLYEPYVKNAGRYVELAERENGEIPDKVDYDYVWGDAIKFLKLMQPELSMVNLETSITDHHEPWASKQIHYRMHPKNTKILSSMGINICALANNHTLDWKRPGLAETLGNLSQEKIGYAGAGMNLSAAERPVIIEDHDGRVLFFSIGHKSSGIPHEWSANANRSGINYLSELDPNVVQGQIQKFRKENDLVILSIHWGGNWGYDIPEAQKEFAHALIDRGVVDVIHGHSSHHPKGIEVYKNKLILYGAGDLINDYEGISGHEEFRGELSLMYFPSLNPANGDLLSLKMVPMEIRKFQLHHASASEAEWLQNTLDRECRKFGGTVRLVDGILEMRWKP